MIQSSQITSSPSPRGFGGLDKPCRTKFNRSKTDKQVFLKEELALDPDIQENPAQFVNDLNNGPKSIFNYLIMMGFHHRRVYATQGHIAKKSNVCTRTVQRAFEKFESLGIMISRYRHMTSKEYRLNQFFYKPEVLSVIRSVLKGAMHISLALLLSCSRNEANEMVWMQSNTRCRTKINTRYLYNNLLLDLTKSYNARAHETPTKWIKIERPSSPIEIREMIMHRENNEIMRKNPFGSAISRIGMLLNLTTAGKVDFARYPEQALLNAEKLYSTSGFKAVDKISWFHSVCINYCNEKKLLPDHKWSGHLAKHFGITNLRNEVKLAPKSNSDEQSKPVQCSHGGREHTGLPDKNLSLAHSSRLDSLKKEEYRDQIKLEYPTPHQSALSSYSEPKNKEFGLSQSTPKTYDPVSGRHYHSTRTVPSRVKASSGIKATAQEVSAALDNLINNVLRGW